MTLPVASEVLSEERIRGRGGKHPGPILERMTSCYFLRNPAFNGVTRDRETPPVWEIRVRKPIRIK